MRKEEETREKAKHARKGGESKRKIEKRYKEMAFNLLYSS